MVARYQAGLINSVPGLTEKELRFNQMYFVALGESVCSSFRVPLTDGNHTIGRKSDCDIHLEDNGISRHHATLYLNNMQAQLLDNDSANGIEVNGQETKNTYLYPGDLFEIGRNMFVVMFD